MNQNIPKTPQQLLETLTQMNICANTTDHDVVKTVAESQALRGTIKGLHSKNLFLKDKKGQRWLVVAHEDRKIDLKALRKRIGAQNLSFGNPELLFECLGVEPGSVTPFSIINDQSHQVQVILDEVFAKAEHVNFHPLVNTMTTTISGADLLLFLEKLEHPPLIIDFAAAPQTT